MVLRRKCEKLWQSDVTQIEILELIDLIRYLITTICDIKECRMCQNKSILLRMPRSSDDHHPNDNL